VIWTRFHGRTGNQMFQWAAARGLAALRGTGVAIDDRLALARGERSITRLFDLPSEDALPPPGRDRPLAHALWRYFGTDPSYRRERKLGYDPAFESFPANAYLHGYWQSERYFAHCADAIRADFVFPPATGRNADLTAEIAAAPSVSVHLRRGDYVGHAAHAVCDQAYYDAACAAVAERLPGDPVFYVFSDDPAWARDNLCLPGRRVVVDHNGPEADGEDMRLMSLCRGHVIANSSFSWWGAWLDPRPDSPVAGPARWFGDPKLSNPDILPARWLAIRA